MLRALLFLVLVGALALVVLSILRRTPRQALSAPDADDDENFGALPPPAPRVDRALSRDTAMDLLYALAFDAPLAATVPPDHVKIVLAVSSGLREAALDPKHAPRRPLLLPELVRAVNDNDTTRRELAKMIVRDPALVGSLLKLANGPLYRRGPQAIERVERALAVLGTNGTRALVAAALVQPLFRAADGRSARFAEIVWDHTQRAAAAAGLHAAAVESSDPFVAELGALLMGLGAIVVYRSVLDRYAALQMKPDPRAIASLLEEQTPRVARQIAASWELSDGMLEALDEQRFERVPPPATALGRSLKFGLLIGALSVLRSRDEIDDDAGLETLAAAGGSGERFERLWNRLAWPPEREGELLPRQS